MEIMKQKNGWIRIAEAAIAIILLASVILVLINKQTEKKSISEAMYQLQSNILNEASSNNTIQSAVLLEDVAPLNSFIRERLPKGMNFTVKICNTAGTCEASIPHNTKDIYVDDIIIASNFTQYQPKKVKFYVWIE